VFFKAKAFASPLSGRRNLMEAIYEYDHFARNMRRAQNAF
jgi:hypothetical protein